MWVIDSIYQRYIQERLEEKIRTQSSPEKKKQAESEVIWDVFMEHWDELTDFIFYQAEYDEERQKVKIRKKAMWKLK